MPVKVASLKKLLLGAAFMAFLTACAQMVPMSHVDMRPVDVAKSRHITLVKTVTLDLSTHYSRILHQGSQWRETGCLSQGTVFRPVNGVFTLEGRHVHEAYLVISENMLVGFYLPVERAFSTLANPVILHVGDAL